MHETFDHTADLGLRIQLADLNTLFAEAGQALTAVLVENPGDVRPTRQLTIELLADEVEYLLFDWLRQLLYHYDTEKFLGAEFEVSADPATGLRATIRGEPLDRTRHEPDHEVKAITYHALRVEKTAGGWLAEVIVDI